MANKTPTNQTSPESYVGYSEAQYDVGTPIVAQQVHRRTTRRPSVPSESFAFNGTWTDHRPGGHGRDQRQHRRSTSPPTTSISSWAGPGTVDVSFNGRHLSTVDVTGIPKLYTLFSGSASKPGRWI